MALVLADRVQETTTTAGTGALTLSGAVSGFQSFAVVGDTNTCYYAIVDSSAWEVGIGTYSTTGPTLTRTTVLSNSSGTTSPLTLSAASKPVFLTYPSEKSVNLDASGNVSPLGTVASGTWQGTTIGAGYGGTGLTTFSAANNAVYSTGATTLTAGTLPVLAGGTGATTSTGSGAVVLATSPALVTPLLGTPTSGDFSTGTFTWPTFNQSTSGNAATATAIAGGGAYQVVYQTSAGVTAFVTNGTTGQILTANTGAAPTFQTSTAASKSYAQAMRIMGMG